ncbi:MULTISPECIES: hypothetical protein [unclassified Streptomyces]|uniref:hypothetical protein n=1 Tax=unclassified Streptomyces TaxID=2593676 RepID=UPI0037FF812C
MSTRTFRGSRTIATMIPVATAVLVGGLLTATPAAAVDTGPVNYFGTVTCAKKFPAPSTSVPQKVKLDTDEDDATATVTAKEGRRGSYKIPELESPLDSKFNLEVTVTCKAPGKAAVTFTRTIPLTDLVEDQDVKLNIK